MSTESAALRALRERVAQELNASAGVSDGYGDVVIFKRALDDALALAAKLDEERDALRAQLAEAQDMPGEAFRATLHTQGDRIRELESQLAATKRVVEDVRKGLAIGCTYPGNELGICMCRPCVATRYALAALRERGGKS